MTASSNVLDKLRDELRRLLDERAKSVRKVDQITTNVSLRGDKSLTAAEQRKFDEAKARVYELDERIEAVEGRITELEDLQMRNDDRERLARELHPEANPETRTSAYRVSSDEPTYRDGGRHSFFADAIAVRYGIGGDPGSTERFNRYMNEVAREYRDVGTGAFGALVVPSYLPEKFAENLRAGRVTANLCNVEKLPESGMTLEIPRGTTGTATASQSDQNDSLTEVDFDETTLTVPVRTIGGQQDVSRQAVERGYVIDRIIFADLAADYAREIDRQILAGAGTNGTHTGIMNSGVLSVTVGDATFADVHKKIADAGQQIASSRFLPPDVIVMHPRRWAWMSVQSDSQGRPLIDSEGKGANVYGSGGIPGEGLVGSLFGLPVYVDANIPTTVSSSTVTGATEDVIIVANRSDLLLWEDSPAPRQFRFDETLGGQLTIKLVVADYSAFTAAWHPEGVAVISGSGLGAPTF